MMSKNPPQKKNQSTLTPARFNAGTGTHTPTNSMRNPLDWIANIPDPPPLKPITERLLVGAARDGRTDRDIPFPDTELLPRSQIPKFGDDLRFGVDRTPPSGRTAGDSAETLIPICRGLLKDYASKDITGGAVNALFDQFLSGRQEVRLFSHPGLDEATNSHSKLDEWCRRTIRAPNMGIKEKADGFTIHTALKAADWDIFSMQAPIDMGTRALNDGIKGFTGDYTNGLTIGINGISLAYILATAYSYDGYRRRYNLRLRYVFYDVFGLDDRDEKKYGGLNKGFTAWWELQHRFGFAPLVTRWVVDKEYLNLPAV